MHHGEAGRRSSRCRAIITAPSIGWWSRARSRSPRASEVELLSENQSTFIPIGKKHRLANPGKIPAFLIEVQSGAYLDEDDIVRFEDMYGRGFDRIASREALEGESPS